MQVQRFCLPRDRNIGRFYEPSTIGPEEDDSVEWVYAVEILLEASRTFPE
jgi:hypothetical protein